MLDLLDFAVQQIEGAADRLGALNEGTKACHFPRSRCGDEIVQILFGIR